MIKVLMARDMNIMPDEAINEQIAALGPGWKVVHTAITLVPWGSWEPKPTDHVQALHTYIGVMVTLEKPDPFVPSEVTEL